VTSKFVRAFEATGVGKDVTALSANLLQIAPHYIGIELGQLSREKQVISSSAHVLLFYPLSELLLKQNSFSSEYKIRAIVAQGGQNQGCL
jgi:hypothetical protein